MKTSNTTGAVRISDDAVHRHAPSQLEPATSRAAPLLARSLSAIHRDEFAVAWDLLLDAWEAEPTKLERTRIAANLSLVAFKRGDYFSALQLAWSALNYDAGVLTSWLLACESALRLGDFHRAQLLIDWGERSGAWNAPFLVACLDRDPDCSRLARALTAWREGRSLKESALASA